MFTDVVDSTRVNDRLGDASMARLWTAHDREARELMRHWRALEIGRSDGFLLLFDDPAHALGFAHGYHRALGRFEPPLKARIGIHVGPVELRCNVAADVARGSPSHEVDGLALPVTARLMAAAAAGQTLVSAHVERALGSRFFDDRVTVSASSSEAVSGEAVVQLRLHCHGFWRFKGVEAPMEMFEAGVDDAAFAPPPDSEKAYRVVRRGTEWVPVRDVPHKLPAERDLFVGRGETLDALARRFKQGARAVTLLGPGGVGKTRLSVRYAWRWLGDHAGGAWFCDLSSAQSLDGIVHAVAQGLGLMLDKADPVQLIGAAIAGRGPCLVILDNFEQVASHAEATLGTWLQSAPEATFLVTSRERLGIVGEHALTLEPMAQREAEELLRERMNAAGASLALTAVDAAALGPLVVLLDCLPLAIELAAARANVMRPTDLLARMGQRFKLLAARGGRHERQTTLRATLDWSWDLLTANERVALAHCSVFEGGFTLAAAQAVLAHPGLDDEFGVVDTLQPLVEKSLLRCSPAHRFDLLRSVRDYAAERLDEAGEPVRQAAMARHWHYFGSLDEQAAIADRCIEAENLVAACRRATAASDLDAAAPALLAAWAALNLTGPFAVAIEMAQALHRVAHERSKAVAMTARWVAGSARFLAGDVATARVDLEEAAGWPEADAALRARALVGLGQLERSLGHRQHAEMLLEAGLTAAQETGDGGLVCRAYNALGVLRLAQGKLEDARRLLDTGLDAARDSNDLKQQAALLGNIGALEHRRGRRGPTVQHYEEALRLARQIGDRRFEGNMRSNLGLFYHENGDFNPALDQLLAALNIARDTGLTRLAANVCCNLGLVQESLGDRNGAIERHREAVLLANGLRDVQLAAHLEVYLGRLLVRVGRTDEGRTCLERLSDPLSDCGDASLLGLLACARAELASACHEPEQVRRWVEAALGHFEQSESKSNPELAREIRTVQGLVSCH